MASCCTCCAINTYGSTPALSLLFREGIRRTEDEAALDYFFSAAGLASRDDATNELDLSKWKIMQDRNEKFMARLLEYGGSACLSSMRAIIGKTAILGQYQTPKGMARNTTLCS